MESRAAVYVRVSTEEQAREGFSLAAQEAACREYCRAQGYRVAYLMRDQGSGRTMDRTGLQWIMEKAAKGSVDVVVVWRRDRFGRSSLNNALTAKLLDDFGVRLEAVATGPQDDSPEVRMFTKMQDAIDEYEVEKINLRCMAGRIQAARQGIWPTRPPRGYLRNKATKRLEPVAEGSQEVKEAFRRVAAGESINHVAPALGASAPTVQAWLKNPAYKGTLCYAEAGTRVEIPDAWPALVDPATWEAAQAAIAATNARLGRYGPGSMSNSAAPVTMTLPKRPK